MPLDLLAAAALCGLAPLTVAVALARRLRVPIAVVAIAAACYALNLLLQQPVFLGLRPVVGGLDPLLLVALLPALVYGVVEEVVRFGSWRLPVLRAHRTSDGALVAGLAWGGAESLLFTALAVAGGQVPGGLALFLLGRVFALAGHVAFAHLSVAAHRRSAWFLPVAIVAHVVFDASVFGLQVLLDPTSAWPTVLFGVLAAAAVAVTAALRRTGDICAYPRAATDVRITS